MNKDNQRNIILVSGPVKSGKSVWAENILRNSDNVCYIATHNLIPGDIDWSDRIKIHKDRRPTHWKLLETNINISRDLGFLNKDTNLLIESLGGFVSSTLHFNSLEWKRAVSELLILTLTFNRKIVFVSEEVGWGVCPPTSQGNIFRERLSELTSEVNNHANEFWLVIHGKAFNMTTIGVPISNIKRT